MPLAFASITNLFFSVSTTDSFEKRHPHFLLSGKNHPLFDAERRNVTYCKKCYRHNRQYPLVRSHSVYAKQVLSNSVFAKTSAAFYRENHIREQREKCVYYRRSQRIDGRPYAHDYRALFRTRRNYLHYRCKSKRIQLHEKLHQIEHNRIHGNDCNLARPGHNGRSPSHQCYQYSARNGHSYKIRSEFAVFCIRIVDKITDERRPQNRNHTRDYAHPHYNIVADAQSSRNVHAVSKSQICRNHCRGINSYTADTICRSLFKRQIPVCRCFVPISLYIIASRFKLTFERNRALHEIPHKNFPYDFSSFLL